MTIIKITLDHQNAMHYTRLVIETNASVSPTVPLTAKLRGYQSHVQAEIESASGPTVFLEFILRFVTLLIAYFEANPTPTAAPVSSPVAEAAPAAMAAPNPPRPRGAQRLAPRIRTASRHAPRGRHHTQRLRQSTRENHAPNLITAQAVALPPHERHVPDIIPRRRKSLPKPNLFARQNRYDLATKIPPPA